MRATAWELAALSFRYPDEELAEAVASGEWEEAAREIAVALGLALPEGWGAVASGEGLRREATRLFVGAPEPVASPYEGVWAAESDGVQPLLFVNPCSMQVERFMRSCGLRCSEGVNEPLDHVAAECELLERLALCVAGTGALEGAPIEADLPGGSPEAAYEAFLRDHAHSWMPPFARRVANASRHPFYRAAAAYLEALVG